MARCFRGPNRAAPVDTHCLGVRGLDFWAHLADPTHAHACMAVPRPRRRLRPATTPQRAATGRFPGTRPRASGLRPCASRAAARMLDGVPRVTSALFEVLRAQINAAPPRRLLAHCLAERHLLTTHRATMPWCCRPAPPLRTRPAPPRRAGMVAIHAPAAAGQRQVSAATHPPTTSGPRTQDMVPGQRCTIWSR